MIIKMYYWLELDKLRLEAPKRILAKTVKMLPVIVSSIFLYLVLTRMGQSVELHVTLATLANNVPILCYAIWGAMFFIIVFRKV